MLSGFFYRPVLALGVVSLTVLISQAVATPLLGTVITVPGGTAVPGSLGGTPGTLLASSISPWSFPVPSADVTSGNIRTAVFRNASGTLDFYYQIENNSGSSTDISRLSAVDFGGFDTWTGFFLNPALLPGGLFIADIGAPYQATRDVSGHDVGFDFGLAPANYIGAGRSSSVLVISTNATRFRAGNASIIGGGTATVSAFQPFSETPRVPEPSTGLLAGGAALALAIWAGRRRQLACCLGVLAITSSAVQATPLTGTVLTLEGTVVFPGVITDNPGTMLISASNPWSFTTTAGTTSGSLSTAVFQNASGTLDFYYQIANAADSVTGIERMTAANFAGFQTSTGYRMDAAPGFVNGSVAPYVATRSVNGIVTTFQFGAMPAYWVLPGTTSEVLVISTNATMFTYGNASIIDGGAATVGAFMPFFVIGDVPTPEPGSVLMMAAGVAVLAFAKLTRRP